MEANRVLFVDDEAALRLTFPLILQARGFEVRTAASVAEALSEITTHIFDILISDLNIGEPGDGFTVVSAMRRTQPNCINFILTGYPAFENALAAIQRQVDDYLIKPAKTEELVELIQKKIADRQPLRPRILMRLSDLLRERADELLENALKRMKANRAIGSMQMSDGERIDNLHITLMEIADQLDSSTPDVPSDLAVMSSRGHGMRRFSTGYEVSMLVTESSIIDSVVYDIVRTHLLLLDTSNLVLDLKRFNCGLQIQLEQAVQAFWNEANRSSGLERAG